eukprot:scaffold42543_cov75-Attheya_sp.AAC.2
MQKSYFIAHETSWFVRYLYAADYIRYFVYNQYYNNHCSAATQEHFRQQQQQQQPKTPQLINSPAD